MDIRLKFVNWFNVSILIFQCCWFMLLMMKPTPFLVVQVLFIAIAYGLSMFDQYQFYKNGRFRLNGYKEFGLTKFKKLENENFPYFLNPNNWLVAVYEINLPEYTSSYLVDQWEMLLWCEEETEYACAYDEKPKSSAIYFQSKDDAVKFILRWGSELERFN